MPQGTIPRGPAFFDPELMGRWGAARLVGMSGAPVIRIGLWGTDKVWPGCTGSRRRRRPDDGGQDAGRLESAFGW